MQLSYSDKPQSKVDYYSLPNGSADVFLRRNETLEEDEEGNTVYVSEEVHFQIEQSVTKEQILANFDYMWSDAENATEEPTLEERLAALEMMELERLFGGIS